jgi:hypothetical protein
VLSGVRTHNLSIQVTKTHALNHVTTVFGYTRGSQTVGRAPRGAVDPPGGASCLYEEHISFVRNMGARILLACFKCKAYFIVY